MLKEDEDLLRNLVQVAVQEFLEAEMNEALGAAKSERSATRLGYRSGSYPRKLITRVPDQPALLYRALIANSARWPEWAESLAVEERHDAFRWLGYPQDYTVPRGDW